MKTFRRIDLGSIFLYSIYIYIFFFHYNMFSIVDLKCNASSRSSLQIRSFRNTGFQPEFTIHILWTEHLQGNNNNTAAVPVEKRYI